MNIKIIKNVSTTGTWCGQVILADSSYTIQPLEEVLWSSNSQVLLDISNGKLIVNDGTIDITDINYAIDYLKNKIQGLISTQGQPFSAKTLPTGKKLFKRLTGISQAVTAGANTFIWVQSSFPLVKFCAIEVIGAELGDKCDLSVLDTTTGTYSGVANLKLNQFSFGINITPGYFRYKSEYDSDLLQNLQIEFIYTSQSAKTIYINLDLNEVK